MYVKYAMSIVMKRSIQANELMPAVAPNNLPNALHSHREHRRLPNSVQVSIFVLTKAKIEFHEKCIENHLNAR